MKKLLTIGFLMCILSPCILNGQDTMFVQDTELKPHSLVIRLNAKEGGSSYGEKGIRFEVEEKLDSETRISYKEAEVEFVRQSSGLSSGGGDQTIVFLLDCSGSMQDKNGNKMSIAKDVIRNTVKKYNLSKKSTFIGTFHDDVSSLTPIGADNCDQVLANVNAISGKNTELYYAVQNKMDEIKSREGKRVIYLFSDGKNENKKNPRYESGEFVRSEKSDVLKSAKGLDSLFQINTIGIGNKNQSGADSGLEEDFLIDLKESTPNKKDTYSYAKGADALPDIMAERLNALDTTHVIEIYPPEGMRIYDGLQRTLKIVCFKNDVAVDSCEYSYVYGTAADPIDISREANLNVQLMALVGLLILLFTLVVLMKVVPVLGFLRFKNQHVMSYSDYLKRANKSDKVQREDPYTMIPFSPGELIVAKCQHIMTLSSWQANGDQCVYYPSKCQTGKGEYGKSKRFFSQQGLNKKLNWLWFGATGGFVAWVLFTFLKKGPVFAFLVEKFNIQQGTMQAAPYIQALLGVALGGALGLMLAWVEERGQSRKESVGRILLRFVIAMVVSVPIFYGAEYLFQNFMQVPFLGQFVSWLIFGTALGLVVTIRSSIEWTRGIWAGLLAALVASLLFLVVQWVVPNANYAPLVGYILYGAILGSVMVTVVDRLEDFEIEYMSPPTFSGRKVGISKWLTGGIEKIHIGTDQGCHVFIKWIDEAVLGKHASLIYDSNDGQVYIEPLGETLVNDRIIKGRTLLKNGDIIKLGNASKSVMRFHAKISQDSAPQTPAPQVNQAEQEKLKQQIKITIKR